jgi:hypothetical protein
MLALFNLFLDICLFRKRPQEIPASVALLNVSLLGYSISGFIVLLLSTSAVVALGQILMDLALLVGLLRMALWMREHPGRFGQTLCALAGSGAVLAVLAMPIIFWIVRQGPTGDVTLPSLLLLGLLVWSIAVMAHILRHALDIPVWVGALCALGYTLLSWTLTGWIAQ